MPEQAKCEQEREENNKHISDFEAKYPNLTGKGIERRVDLSRLFPTLSDCLPDEEKLRDERHYDKHDHYNRPAAGREKPTDECQSHQKHCAEEAKLKYQLSLDAPVHDASSLRRLDVRVFLRSLAQISNRSNHKVEEPSCFRSC